MSISAYAIAVRNHLRTNLENFYGDNITDTPASIPLRARNCKVMLDEHPTADCGQEFVSIYGSHHQPHKKDLMMALDEEFGLTVAISRKIAVVPPDVRGELGYINDKSIDGDDAWLAAWQSTEARCREIVFLLQGQNRYAIMAAANTLIAADRGGPFTEPLQWQGTDPAPRQVGADYFWSYDKPEPDSDNVFGLVQKVYLGDAVRMQNINDLDRVPS